ncbi:ribosomal protein L17 [Mortierella sp. GBAus27b]|nr:hypothetical protein BGX31_000334 [Mortierella sp. GBA43]KAI8353010.1 ribosomal protein L17 [Mortierella sp. GBAus27b]
MHHGKHFRRLNRTSSHRKSLFRNLVTELIQHDRIKTTLPKAQELKAIADQMITLGKRGDLHAKVQAASYLREHPVTIPKLFGPLAERYKHRKGGYTRIHKLGNRYGDNAPVAVIELIDGPGDLKNEMLFKSLARSEKKKPGSIKEIVEANLAQKGTITEGLSNKAMARHLPKVMTTNKWELSDLENKIMEMSIAKGSDSEPTIRIVLNLK